MSDIWPHATKQSPCPVCGKPDWCRFGIKAMLCMRTPSEHTNPSGGWYHFYDGFTRSQVIPRLPSTPPPRPLVGAELMMAGFVNDTSEDDRRELAKDLNVDLSSVYAIGAGYSIQYNAWAFPMKDGQANIVGIRLRNRAGFKWSIKGSRNGVFVNKWYDAEVNKLAFIPEGPTNVMAFWTLGLFAISRPSAATGFDIVLQTLNRLGIRKAVIVADNDDGKDKQGKDKRVGQDTSKELQKYLNGIKTTIWMPMTPHKDIRDFIKAGGSRKLIESQINQKVWI